MKKVIFIAGEPSGDAIAAKIIQHLDKNKIKIFGVGGLKMKNLGFKSIFNIEEISVMGFMEVLMHLHKIIKRINQVVDFIIKEKPNLIVTCDSPGFAVSVVKKLKKLNYNGKIIHVVAPTVWAYKEKRAKKFAKLFDAIYCLLPFEPQYFKKHGLKSYFVGNISIEDELFKVKNEINAKFENKDIEVQNIVITLGSRFMEVKRHIKIISKTMNILQNKYNIKEFIFPTLPHLQNYIQKYLEKHNKNCHYYVNSSQNAMQEAILKCDIAIAKSGTNTLQFLSNFKPIIVYYKMNLISYYIIKMMLKIKFANLINIIAQKIVIPELIQSDFNPLNISKAVQNVVTQETQNDIAKYLLQMLPNIDIKPSLIVAEAINDLIAK